MDVVDDLVARVERLLAAATTRVIIGIAGKPGSGKSTLAQNLVDALGDAACLPMDGFHLADAALRTLGLLGRKGAPETFDAQGYGALLERIARGESVWAPGFERDLEQPVAQSLWIDAAARVVITEGNYLLLPDWQRARDRLTEVWYLTGDEQTRLRRLTARHEQFGKTPQAARDWVRTVDGPNAELVAAYAPSADLVIDLGG